MKSFTTLLATLAVGGAFAVAADEKPAGDAKAGDAKTGEAKPGNAKSADAKPGENTRRNPEEAFKKLDTNGDNAVSLEEFKAGPIAKRNPDRADEMFKRRDKDGDGKLTLEEFKAPRPAKKE
jgi:hypothetical protein